MLKEVKCSIYKHHLLFNWLQRDLNPHPLSLWTNTQAFGQNDNIWPNPHSIFAWMSRNSLLGTHHHDTSHLVTNSMTVLLNTAFQHFIYQFLVRYFNMVVEIVILGCYVWYIYVALDLLSKFISNSSSLLPLSSG